MFHLLMGRAMFHTQMRIKIVQHVGAITRAVSDTNPRRVLLVQEYHMIRIFLGTMLPWRRLVFTAGKTLQSGRRSLHRATRGKTRIIGRPAFLRSGGSPALQITTNTNTEGKDEIYVFSVLGGIMSRGKGGRISEGQTGIERKVDETCFRF